MSTFDGHTLLREQADLLASSNPSDINYLQFLRIRLSAQQRRTSQINRWQRHPLMSEASLHHGLHTEGEHPHRGSRLSGNYGESPNSVSALIQSCASDGGLHDDASHSKWRSQAHPSMPPSSPYAAGSTEQFLEAMDVVRRSYTSGDSMASATPNSAPPPAQHIGNGGMTGVDIVPNSATVPIHASGVATTADLASKRSPLDDVPAVATRRPAPLEEAKEIALEPCPNCHRTFALDRLERHIAACSKHRIEEQRSRVSASGRAQRGSGMCSTSASVCLSDSLLHDRVAASERGGSSWRQQSENLRLSLSGGTLMDDRVPCSGCGRRFAADVAERHIPTCSKGLSSSRRSTK